MDIKLVDSHKTVLGQRFSGWIEWFSWFNWKLIQTGFLNKPRPKRRLVDGSIDSTGRSRLGFKTLVMPPFLSQILFHYILVFYIFYYSWTRDSLEWVIQMFYHCHSYFFYHATLKEAWRRRKKRCMLMDIYIYIYIYICMCLCTHIGTYVTCT